MLRLSRVKGMCVCIEFRQQMRSCLIEWYPEIKSQITSGNTVIQKTTPANGVIQKYALFSSSWSTLCNMNSLCSNWLAKVTSTVKSSVCAL